MSDRLMSKEPHSQSRDDNDLRRRFPIYVACAIVAVLALAYFDGGEEPIHRIVHKIALPAAGVSGQ